LAARRIRQVPTLSHLTLGGASGSAIYPLEAANLSLWYSGQIAIWQGLHALGLKERDRVLVPAYCCGSEIDALLRAGLKLAFYRVGPDLVPDFDHIEQLCAEPAKALFIIHYFGWPQPIDSLLALAENHGMFLIEDNAHGLCSFDEMGRPLGSLGDIGIFSFTKTLAIPDGGALVIRQDTGRDDQLPAGERPSLLRTAGKFAGILRGAVSHGVPAAAKVVRKARSGVAAISGSEIEKDDFSDRPPPEADLDKNVLDIDRASWRMSSISRYLLRHTNHETIRDIRRRNFIQLSENFEGGTSARPLLTHLPPGCSPMMFPVWAEQPLDLLRHLLKAGIESDIFWEFTHPEVSMEPFPFEDDLKKRCIEIPVHQCLDEDDIALIADALNSWNAKPA
jgi:dTDP-4-amino-4,6-dideoxygalactose transaminase